MLVQFQNCSFFDNYRSTLIAENIRCKMGQNPKLLRNEHFCWTYTWYFSVLISPASSMWIFNISSLLSALTSYRFSRLPAKPASSWTVTKGLASWGKEASVPPGFCSVPTASGGWGGMKQKWRVSYSWHLPSCPLPSRVSRGIFIFYFILIFLPPY